MKYVPCYRVSTASQGKSGLGLSAQREIINRFVKNGDELLANLWKWSRASEPMKFSGFTPSTTLADPAP